MVGKGKEKGGGREGGCKQVSAGAVFHDADTKEKELCMYI